MHCGNGHKFIYIIAQAIYSNCLDQWSSVILSSNADRERTTNTLLQLTMNCWCAYAMLNVNVKRRWFFLFFVPLLCLFEWQNLKTCVFVVFLFVLLKIVIPSNQFRFQFRSKIIINRVCVVLNNRLHGSVNIVAVVFCVIQQSFHQFWWICQQINVLTAKTVFVIRICTAILISI